MPSRLFEELNSRATSVRVPAGKLMFSPGDRASAVYLIRDGRVALIWQASNNINPMDVVGPGQIVGLPAALNGEYSIGARAVTDCDAGFVPVDEALALLESNAYFLREAIGILAQEVAKMRALLRVSQGAE